MITQSFTKENYLQLFNDLHPYTYDMDDGHGADRQVWILRWLAPSINTFLMTQDLVTDILRDVVSFIKDSVTGIPVSILDSKRHLLYASLPPEIRDAICLYDRDGIIEACGTIPMNFAHIFNVTSGGLRKVRANYIAQDNEVMEDLIGHHRIAGSELTVMMEAVVEFTGLEI